MTMNRQVGWSEKAQALLRNQGMSPPLREETSEPRMKVGDRFVACGVCLQDKIKQHRIAEVELIYREGDFRSLCDRHQGHVVELYSVKRLEDSRVG